MFPAGLLQTNRALRRRGLDWITRKCLWIRVDFLSRSIRREFEALESLIPNLPEAYRDALTTDLPGVKFVLGGSEMSAKRARSFNQDTMSLLFPFNYQSFAALYGRMLALNYNYTLAKIELSDLPIYLRRIVDVQILPIVELIRVRWHISITEPTGKTENLKRYPSWNLRVAPQLKKVMAMIQALDAEGCTLEASILCMYYGHILVLSAVRCPTIGSMTNWLEMEEGIAASNWLDTPWNISRMCFVRTLSYIESRALYAYQEGVRQYGHQFVKRHYNDVVRFHNGQRAKYRWLDQTNEFWHGLPDHEVAKMLHVQALAIEHNNSYLVRLIEDDPKNDLVREMRQDGRTGDCEAAYLALRAWNLDMGNLEYATTLHSMVQVAPYILDELREYISEHEFLLLDDLKPETGPEDRAGNPNLKFRAQRLAWLADVAYDKRREADMPTRKTGGQDFKAVKRLMGTESAKEIVERCLSTGENKTFLRWEEFDIKSDDMWNTKISYLHDDIAPWHCWKHMHESRYKGNTWKDFWTL